MLRRVVVDLSNKFDSVTTHVRQREDSGLRVRESSLHSWLSRVELENVDHEYIFLREERQAKVSSIQTTSLLLLTVNFSLRLINQRRTKRSLLDLI